MFDRYVEVYRTGGIVALRRAMTAEGYSGSFFETARSLMLDLMRQYNPTYPCNMRNIEPRWYKFTQTWVANTGERFEVPL